MSGVAASCRSVLIASRYPTLPAVVVALASVPSPVARSVAARSQYLPFR